MKKLLASAIILAGAFVSGSALAQTANLTIEAKVIDSCSLTFESPTIRFSIAKNGFTGAEQASYFTASCGNNALSIALDGGQAKNTANRAMVIAGGTNTIPYAIYQGSSGTTLWNNTDSVYKVSASDSQNSVQQNFRVQVPQTSITTATPNGTYTDQLVATISYDAS
ncbi:MAG: hypothetical protein DU429_07460 [Candidatus Tokpelaia sp.]|nr:MAG: hypothetical protein DU430_08860 [Candidatus Tokpelaia sp.]KAA6205748.1 MAG: hypothetical protein DU429_07460 [Candidatus Tokpelaia sp.]